MFVYKPVKVESSVGGDETRSTADELDKLRQQRLPRFLSQSEDNIVVASQGYEDRNVIMIAAEHLNLNLNAGESVLNPMQQSLIFTSAEIWACDLIKRWNIQL